MAASPGATTVSLLPLLRQKALRQAVASLGSVDLRTSAGHERAVQTISRAYADYEQRTLPPGARPLDPLRIEAIVRVGLRDLVAACA